MAVDPTSSPVVPNHYLTESSEIVARQHDRKELMWNIAAKVTLVALFVIGAAVLTAVILGSTVLSTPLSWLIFGLVLTTPVLGYMEDHFVKWANQHHAIAEIEHGVADHLTKIVLWKQSDIKTFYEQQRLPGPASLATLPLVARFNYWKEKTDSLLAEARKHLDPDVPGSYIKEQPDPAARYQERDIGWDILECNALPAKLQSAIILQMIYRPDREIDPARIGACRSVSMGQRLCEQILDHKDSYFEFADRRPPVALITVRDSSPADLRLRIFQ